MINEDFDYFSNLNIKNQYKDYDLNLLQFLVYGNFLLIYFFDDNKNCWNYDVFKIEDNIFNKKENNTKSLISIQRKENLIFVI